MECFRDGIGESPKISQTTDAMLATGEMKRLQDFVLRYGSRLASAASGTS
jgi:hypothetical protein